jgi:hypothetical protein
MVLNGYQQVPRRAIGDPPTAGRVVAGRRAAVKALNPEVYLLGEIRERDPSGLQGDQLDALMNYAMGR